MIQDLHITSQYLGPGPHYFSFLIWVAEIFRSLQSMWETPAEFGLTDLDWPRPGCYGIWGIKLGHGKMCVCVPLPLPLSAFQVN